ncbi:hypothetical protein HLH33_06345 [Gluconacetobacter diazotrophicus]|uniref:Uncharacterized protein n=2 Tax=Gluconacetobacter diazotrophicus TaxID=33996 RepID=A0A7W4FDT1_GLUDI|nr:hypothetical protein [Gluconacetobacter diazotrophicus]
MAWSHAGIGANIDHQGKNLWDTIKVPFVSVLADPPCAMPQNHFMRAHYVANAYVFSEWLRIQREIIRSPQYSTLINCVGVVPQSERNIIPWRDRPQRMAFIKTGGNPEDRREKWTVLPPRWRAILEDAAVVALRHGSGDITDILFASCKEHGLSNEHRLEILFTLMQELDLYVRECRMTSLVTALLDLPVDIYGRGWDHLSHKTTRARFHAPIDASNLSSIYSATQFILNTSPNISSGIHERVAYGMDARCCVVSDENAFTKKNIRHIPTFFGINVNEPNLSDCISEIYFSDVDYTDATQIGADFISSHFDGRVWMNSLLRIADEIRVAGILRSGFPDALAFV